VSWSTSPPDRPGASPQRVLALGGAAAVTAMALAGSLGFGPGAAAARQPAASAATATTAGEQAAPADPRTGATSGQQPSATSGSHSNGWVVVKPSSKSGSGSGDDTVSPALPAGSGNGKRVVYDISDQRVWLVEPHDVVTRTYLVSGSRRGDLVSPGTYTVYSRSLHAISFNHKETMKYMVRFAHGQHSAIGFHDIPVSDSNGSLVQSRADLGTPLSAGCIRQSRRDAKALWRFAPDGTTVVVTA
jgi:lipoprotein-anchoring transpeptidase ErfK/SrfK